MSWLAFFDNVAIIPLAGQYPEHRDPAVPVGASAIENLYKSGVQSCYEADEEVRNTVY